MVKTFLTGTAQPVTNTVERVRELFKDRAEWTPLPASERKTFKRSQKPEPEPRLLDSDEDQQAAAEPETEDNEASDEPQGDES